MKIQHFCIAAGLSLGGLLSPLAVAVEVPGPVVNTEWLATHQNEVLTIDVRKKPESFAKGHIPGSIFMNWKKQARAKKVVNDVKLIKMLPEKAAFEATMRSLGVNNDSAIVINHLGKNVDTLGKAARVYWTLKYFGHDNVALLDGGFAQWKAEKRPVSTESAPPKAGDFTARAERKEMLATTADVEQAMNDDGIQLVDTRGIDFYLGLSIKSYVYNKGHIPSAKHFPPSLVTHWKAPANLYSKDTLNTALKALKVDTKAPSITYCNSGHYAAASWFVLSEILGNKQVKLYDGSLHEWTKNQKAPMVTMKVD